MNNIVSASHLSSVFHNKYNYLEFIIINLLKPISSKYNILFLKIIIDFTNSALFYLMREGYSVLTRSFISFIYSYVFNTMGINYEDALRYSKGSCYYADSDQQRYAYCSLLLFVLLSGDEITNQKVLNNTLNIILTINN